MESGPKQLADWIDRRFDGDQIAAAKFLEVNYEQLSQWKNSLRRIGLDNAVLIQQKTGIPVEAWAAENLDKSAEAGNGSGSKRKTA